MAQMLLICPLCKRENAVGTRFCKYCGRLLIDPGMESSAMEQAPLYGAPKTSATPWGNGESEVMADITNARIIIRAYPADFDGQDSSVAQHVGEFALQGRTVTVGRGRACDIVFEKDNLTSRQHAILQREENRYVVADLGSSNGTFINGLEIREPTPLRHGDRVLIGQHELIYLLDQPRPIASPAPQPETAEAPAEAVDVPADGAAADLAEGIAEVRARPNNATAGPTAKHASVARLSSELAASASRLAKPQRESAELDAIRVRLVEASEALTRQAGAQAALAEQRRARLLEARERVADLIADLRGDDTSGASPTQPAPVDLIEVVARVAEDPNNLEYLRALASHAAEVAQALRAQGPSEGQWSVERARTLRTLDDIHSRLRERE